MSRRADPWSSHPLRVGRVPWAGALGGLAAVLLSACTLQPHRPPVATPALAQAAVQQRSPDDPALRARLASQGIDTRQWPLPAWDGAALQALALAVHPQVLALQAELAQVLATRDGDRAAARSPLLQSLDLNLEHHSADGASGRPWSLGIALDLGLSDAWLGVSRRAAREAAADAAADEAVQQAAAAVWQLHRAVRDAHRAWSLAQQRQELAAAVERARRDEAQAWQKRLVHGAADAREAAQADQRQREAAHAARTAEAELAASRQALATALGLTQAQAAGMVLSPDQGLGAPSRSFPAEPATAALQQAALLDRLDVRAGVARYAAADAALRLELARQLPELVLKPGWAWDQGDRRWSLGVGLSLPPVGGNRHAIAQASARRDAEAARFELLQLQALAELDAARAAAAAARAELLRSSELADAAARLAQRVQQRLAAGSADRLEVLEARLGMLDARRRVLDAEAALGGAWAALEDAVQRPLDRLDRARGDWLVGAGERRTKETP